MYSIPEVSFQEISGKKNTLGIITLTRQQALNALNHAMFLAVDQQLMAWEKEKNIHAVVIQAAEGRAFSAGGDIRRAYELKMTNDPTLEDFFKDEYRMNRRIHHFSKPYIALLDGITMGGGVGISLHGSHRVASEKLIFSMPETGIGFYPDVGTTYFLSRLHHKMGIYLGLTGARLSAADCKALGIVQEIVPSIKMPMIIDALANSSEKISEVLKTFSIDLPTSDLFIRQDIIEACFSKKTVEEIIDALEKREDPWCQETADLLKTKSPTSLKVTLLALQKASRMNFDECMDMELELTCRFIREHDFFEGIRAAIIDKDQRPKWVPARLSDVSLEHVESYFL